MANTVIVENLLQLETIRLKDKQAVIKQLANLKYQGTLRKSGDTVSVQQFPNTFGNIGGTAGADISQQDWTITKFTLTVDQTWQNGVIVKDIEEVQSNLDLQGQISNRFAYASSDHEDQYIASLVTQAFAANILSDRSPVTLSSSNTYSTILGLKTALSKQNARGVRALFISPEIHEKLLLEGILNSTEKGLEFRLNGEIGRVAGFRVFETNNLHHVVNLTMDTIPVDTNTMTIQGLELDTTNGGYKEKDVVFTFVGAGAAAAAGDISIGANVAAAQQNTIDAINLTGTASAATYVAVAAADRTALRNAFISCGTSFNASDVVNITSSFELTPVETFGPATNIFGDDAVLMFASDMNAINFVGQFDRVKVTDAPLGFRMNILQEKVYKGKVLGENAKGIATVEIKT